MRFTLLIIITTSTLLLCSRFNKNPRKLGELPFDESKTMFFRIYQSSEFDHVTTITSEIVNNSNEVVFRKRFITGTMDYNYDLSSFHAGIHDSIVYLSYNDRYKVFAVFDLRRNVGYPFNDFDYKKSFELADTLFERLQSYEPKLKAKWRE